MMSGNTSFNHFDLHVFEWATGQLYIFVNSNFFSLLPFQVDIRATISKPRHLPHLAIVWHPQLLE